MFTLAKSQDSFWKETKEPPWRDVINLFIVVFVVSSIFYHKEKELPSLFLLTFKCDDKCSFICSLYIRHVHYTVF